MAVSSLTLLYNCNKNIHVLIAFSLKSGKIFIGQMFFIIDFNIDSIYIYDKDLVADTFITIHR